MNKFVVSGLSLLLILSVATACAPSKRTATPANNKGGANNNRGKTPAAGSDQSAGINTSNGATTTADASKLTPTQIQAQPTIDTTKIDASKITNITSYVSSQATAGTNPSDSMVMIKLETSGSSVTQIGAKFDSSSGTLKVVPAAPGATAVCSISPVPTAAVYAAKGAAACTQITFTMNVSVKSSSGTAQAGVIKITNARGNNFKTNFDFGDDKGVVDKTHHTDFAAISKVELNSLTYADSSGTDLTDTSKNKKFFLLGIDGLISDASKTSSFTDAVVLQAGTADERHYNVVMTGFPKTDSAGHNIMDQSKSGTVIDTNSHAPTYLRTVSQSNADGSDLKSATVISTIDLDSVATEDDVTKQKTALGALATPDDSADNNDDSGANPAPATLAALAAAPATAPAAAPVQQTAAPAAAASAPVAPTAPVQAAAPTTGGPTQPTGVAH